jgi:hypothetical protein
MSAFRGGRGVRRPMCAQAHFDLTTKKSIFEIGKFHSRVLQLRIQIHNTASAAAAEGTHAHAQWADDVSRISISKNGLLK